MQRDPRAYLWDVREAALAIGSFVAGMNAATYASTPLVHSAVERKFEIIGEALNQLARLDASLASRIPSDKMLFGSWHGGALRFPTQLHAMN
jgi:uncharacterized protein with HEPN domain